MLSLPWRLSGLVPDRLAACRDCAKDVEQVDGGLAAVGVGWLAFRRRTGVRLGLGGFVRVLGAPHPGLGARAAGAVQIRAGKRRAVA